MSAVSRLAAAAVAAAVVFVTPIVVLCPASADPCAQTLPSPGPAGAVPPKIFVPRAPGPVEHIPSGRKPAGAQDQAPPPEVGPLPPDASLASPPTSAPWENQAEVIPGPTPPGTPDQAAPNRNGPNPAAHAEVPAPAAPAPAPAAAVAVPSTSFVGWINGPVSPNDTFNRFAISGADLGIMWDNGDPNNDQTLLAFGDTFGDCGVPGQQWRSNTLLRSSDRTLTDGLYVPDPVPDTVAGANYGGSPVTQNPAIPGKYNFSRQIIASLGIAPTEVTIIPTAGISVGSRQYINFMSIRRWGNPGQWTTNFSALAVSDDNGQTWSAKRATVRWPWWGNQKFQQGAFVRPGDGYLYSFGTPSGRGGPAYVARVREGSELDLTKYQYWGKQWWNFFGSDSWVTNKPFAARVVIPAPVSEMSVQYNTYLNKFVAMYCNGSNNVVMRTAPAAQGPWSSPRTLVTSKQLPGGIYAPFMHPWTTGKDLYFSLSLWSAYSVMLMHTVLP
ncbi:DUF4185 domain-containing protein [Mycobacterium conspicuum]|jgi:hypothetical protein|uniref:Uncharacterized protein n=1 Tax=Mycobacterium conspicuum TaxID=44010 RepID=A0A1X1THD1_9MYCO|nr:DUF4185 domain-containing protein [Mycobacterium conspicuum]ORV43951.1 hypothetical protein AWC00_09760 [Mycobacterium conspicuum]BBZ38112.1 hypothetical protein MCNS_11750 [Mycobacterium conspicuum]